MSACTIQGSGRAFVTLENLHGCRSTKLDAKFWALMAGRPPTLFADPTPDSEHPEIGGQANSDASVDGAVDAEIEFEANSFGVASHAASKTLDQSGAPIFSFQTGEGTSRSLRPNSGSSPDSTLTAGLGTDEYLVASGDLTTGEIQPPALDMHVHERAALMGRKDTTFGYAQVNLPVSAANGPERSFDAAVETGTANARGLPEMAVRLSWRVQDTEPGSVKGTKTVLPETEGRVLIQFKDAGTKEGVASPNPTDTQNTPKIPLGMPLDEADGNITKPPKNLHYETDFIAFRDSSHLEDQIPTIDGPKEARVVSAKDGANFPTSPKMSVAHQIHSQVQAHLHKEGQSVELRLSPSELGHVRVGIHHADATVGLILTIERPETLDLLRRNVEVLAEEFSKAGFADLSFEFRQEERAGQFGSSKPEPTNKEAPDSVQVDSMNSSKSGSIGPQGKVDIFI